MSGAVTLGMSLPEVAAASLRRLMPRDRVTKAPGRRKVLVDTTNAAADGSRVKRVYCC